MRLNWTLNKMQSWRSIVMQATIGGLVSVFSLVCVYPVSAFEPENKVAAAWAEGDEISGRLQTAREAALQKKYAEAITQYEDVLEQSPGNVAAKLGIAKATSWQGDFERSLKLYDEILERSPHLYDAIVGKGFTLSWMGRTEEALELLRRATRIHPEDVEVRSEVARLSGLVSKEITRQPVRGAKPATSLPQHPAIQPQPFPEPIAPAVALQPEPKSSLAAIFFVTLASIVVAGFAVWQFQRGLTARRQHLDRDGAKATVDLARKRVLLVEENEEAAEFLQMLFGQLGAEVERLNSVSQLFSSHRRRPADLVLLDVQCNKELIAEVVETGLARYANVAFACATVAESQVIHDAGFRSIRKPFRILDLSSLLQDMVIHSSQIYERRDAVVSRSDARL